MIISNEVIMNINNLSLSIRALNTLRSINIETVNDLLHFFQQNHDFLKIKNCGLKTNNELKSVCISLLKYSANAPEVKVENLAEKEERENMKLVWEQLDNFKKTVIDNTYKVECKKLSNRTQNRLRELETEMKWPDHIFVGFDYMKLINLGKGCLDEIEVLREKMTNAVITINTKDSRTIKLENLIAYINIRGRSNLNINSNDLNSCLDQDGNVKLFSLIKFYIENENFFKPSHLDIQKKIFYSEEIANNIDFTIHNLTNERIRQIKINYINQFKEKYSLINEFIKIPIENYLSFLNSPIVKIDQEFIDIINEKEEVNFNKLFYYLYFSSFYSDYVLSIGNIYTKNNIVYYDKNLKELYLINKKAAGKLNFIVLQEKLQNIINKEIIYENYKEIIKSLNIEDENSPCLEIIKYLMEKEYDLTITSDFTVIRKHVHKRKLVDLIYEIISEIGEPVKIEIILQKLNSDNYNNQVDKETLRNTIIRNKEYFICFGRTSTYGLKSWEDEKDDIKGGTIRTIVKEYLESQDLPCHMYEIWEHVKKYRKKTNQTSVYRNIEAERNKIFTFYNGGFIGLRGKQYAEENLTFKKMSGMHYSKRVMEKYSGWLVNSFVKEYSRLYDYTEAQILSVLSEKEKNGKISLNNGFLIVL